jgi:hypothetical protein
MINHPVPASVWEWKRAHRQILQDEAGTPVLDTALDRDPAEVAVAELAVSVMAHLGIIVPEAPTVTEEVPKKEVGALSRLWRMATQSFGPKAAVEGGAR